jgi:hypothetical protein
MRLVPAVFFQRLKENLFFNLFQIDSFLRQLQTILATLDSARRISSGN